MHIETMYKWQACRSDNEGWSAQYIYNDWDNVYSDAFLVEVPDRFVKGETVSGDIGYFDERDRFYQVCTGDELHNRYPALAGYGGVFPLKVIGPAPEEDD